MDKYFLMGGTFVALIGAITDLRDARIPNRLTYTSLLAALLCRFAFRGLSGLESGTAGMLGAGGLFLFFFLIGAMGGGDTKLMAAVGAWIGSTRIINFILAAALAGGILALARILSHKTLGATLRNTTRLICFAFNSGLQPHPELNVNSGCSQRVPFGVAIAAGALFCTATSIWWR